MDNEKIKFSVLMSIYKNDKKEFVQESIESIINQTVKPNEIIVVQDGPIPEEIKSLVSEYEKYDFFKLIVLNENQGLGKALNIGLENCQYDIVARMDSDDICLEDRFEKQIKEFQKDDSLSVVGGFINEFIENPSEIIGVREVPLTNEEIIKHIKSRNPFNHMTVMFRKKDVFECRKLNAF